MDDRVEILRNDGYVLGIATLGLVNGMNFSPWFEPAFFLIRPFWPSFLPQSPLLLFYFASLILSVWTVILGGVGAALYERAAGLQASTSRSMLFWLLGTAALSMPAFGRLLGFF